MLFLDLEVYSDVSITDAPLDVYAKHPSTKIILACAAFDDKAIVAWETPEEVEEFLEIMRVYRGALSAWNIGYERTVLAAQGAPTAVKQWTDAMVHARYLGLPGGLKQSCKVPFLGVPEEAATKSESLLIRKFCMPYDKTPGTAEEWAAFVEYCKKDVASLRHIHKRLSGSYPFPATERKVWELDQLINERGLPIDIDTARHAAGEVVRLTGEAQARLRQLTGLDNPNSVQQLSAWLKERGYPHDSLGKDFIQQALDREGDRLTNECREVLDLRLSAAKSSVKKFAAILEGTSPDNRLRNQFKYYGAHTGRWSGRGAQPQNLPRTPTDEKELENLIRRGMIPTIDTLSSCIRPVICAPPGKKLVVADLSAIENRVLGWLSGCEAMLQIYRDNRDPYVDFATRMYLCKYDDVTKQQRQVCKPAVLGCGYGLGPGQERILHNGQIQFTGLRKYAESMGVTLSAEGSREMVSLFRSSFYEVVEYWGYLEQAFYAACKSKKRQQVGAVYLGATADAVYIELPSGRRIHYLNPRVWSGMKGKEIRFDGLRNGQWGSVSTWGGSLTENVVQAVARDVLVEGMIKAEECRLTVVGHCHDEIIAEVDERWADADKLLEFCMQEPIKWAPSLPLAAEGWEGKRYAKG